MSRDQLDVFRRTVRQWLESSYPPELRNLESTDQPAVWGGSKQEYPVAAARLWLDRMAAKGWVTPTWSVDHGGAGLTQPEADVLAEELRTAGMRPPLVRQNQGITMLGPVLREYGSEEQRRRFLPPIASGAVRWCQGFSEPGAGSDLANVRTRAERDGDVYRVTGHKIWSSYAHLSDWMFCLVRTDPDVPKQAGISFLLVALDDPAITVAPITLLSGKSDFCEVFLDDVRVPVDQRIGAPGQGWSIAKRLLEHERAMLGSAGNALAGGGGSRASLPEQALALGGTSGGRLHDPVLRHRLARHLADVASLKALTRRAADEHRRDPHLASILKLVSTELHMDRQDLLSELGGLEASAWAGPAFDESTLSRPKEWLRSRANSIEGGTSEIQLNIIAKHGLGLG